MFRLRLRTAVLFTVPADLTLSRLRPQCTWQNINFASPNSYRRGVLVCHAVQFIARMISLESRSKGVKETFAPNVEANERNVQRVIHWSTPTIAQNEASMAYRDSTYAIFDWLIRLRRKSDAQLIILKH